MGLKVRVVGLLAALALCAAAQPTVNTGGIVNGASFVQAGLPNGDIAQGSIFSVFGTKLGPAAGVTTGSWPLQTNLGGVMVHVLPAGSATPMDAILLYVRADQINAVLPSAVPVGQATLTVEYPAGQMSNGLTFNVVVSSPGLLAQNQAGNGPASLQNFISASNTPINTISNSAHQGDTAVLWGTGIGKVTFDETQPPPVTDLTATDHVQVFVGGAAITPLFAGRSGYAGEDQINFTLPDNAATGCYVPVEVMANGVVSNSTTMSIVAKNSASLTCTDQVTSLPANLNQDLRQGGISLSSVKTDFLGIPFNADIAGGQFQKWAAADVGKLHGNFGVSTFGACSVYTFFGQGGSFGEVALPVGLDAGPQLNLKLPDNSTMAMPQSTTTKGSYAPQFGTGQPPPFLTAGAYTVDNGTGGVDVGGFTASLTVPTILTWTNMAAITTVTRSAGQQVTWSGGDQQTPDPVIITGMSILADFSAGAGFFCLARASDQQFTVPAEVLARLPVSDATSGTGTMGIAEFSAMSKSKVNNVPQGLDVLSFSYQFMSMKAVAYQ